MYLSNHSNWSHPSLQVIGYLFLLLKRWQLSILWSVLCRFHSLYHCCHSLSLIVICYHVLSLAVSLAIILCHSLYHSLSFVVTRTNLCHSLSHSLPFVVTRCPLLSLVVPIVVVTLCPSLSLVVPLVVVTRYHSLSLVATRCTTRLSFYKRSPQTAKIRKKSFWVTSVSILKYLHI